MYTKIKLTIQAGIFIQQYLMTATEFPGQRQNILGNFVTVLKERQNVPGNIVTVTKFPSDKISSDTGPTGSYQKLIGTPGPQFHNFGDPGSKLFHCPINE